MTPHNQLYGIVVLYPYSPIAPIPCVVECHDIWLEVDRAVEVEESK